MLIAANCLNAADFCTWAFYPGMRYMALDKWWGDFGRRDFPHEGLDFCLFLDPSARLRHLGANTRIPAMHDGVVRALFTDYLGQVVIIEHGNAPDERQTYLSAYAHTQPLNKVHPGTRVKRGDIIATIADTRHSKANILPHLHYSIARATPEMVYKGMVWNDMRDPAKMVLLNPERIVDWPLREIDLEFQLSVDLPVR
jgi:murein DD-endopeptidase MepM/ murein hydrolase activator NlpD